MQNTKTVAITGASGFIAKNLVRQLLLGEEYKVKLLVRNANQDLEELIELGVQVVEGDLLNLNSLIDFFEEGCVVVNLAYLKGDSETDNIAAANNLVEACEMARIFRLIHCSTADVAGRVSSNCVTENIICKPLTDYAITKYKVENVVLENRNFNFERVVLRPTAVFGIDGENLKKLVRDLKHGKKIINYFRSCLFGNRRMNLVSVENVVAAIIFLGNSSQNIDEEIFIVSDDDSSHNNFLYVEHSLMNVLGVSKYYFPRIYLPEFILRFILIFLGRNNINPYSNYSSDKLIKLGYKKKLNFDQALNKYTEWLCTQQFVKNESTNK